MKNTTTISSLFNAVGNTISTHPFTKKVKKDAKAAGKRIAQETKLIGKRFSSAARSFANPNS